MAAEDFKNVWVYIDKANNGTVKNVSLELLNGAKGLVKDTGEKVVAVIIGKDNQAAIDSVKKYGADQIINVDGAAFEQFDPKNDAFVFKALVDEYKPATILFGSTTNGQDLSARLAAKVQTSVVEDASAAVTVNGTSTIEWTRSIYGGKFLTKVSSAEARPQIATVRTGVYDKVEAASDAEVTAKDIDAPENSGAKVIDVIKSDSNTINLEEAKVIVGAGRGVSQDHLDALKKLADLFEAGGVGGTRPVIDEGLLPQQQQIGLSGKKVSPNIYFAVGISGAIQHVQGIVDSKTIVAINRDADAPIFEVADYGVVGDLNKIIPAVTEEIAKRK